MRLGIIMMGIGAYAAANVGVLRALRLRGIEPYAVCGMDFGAWIAAQHVCGMDDAQMDAAMLKAAKRGKRLLSGGRPAGAVLREKAKSISEGRGINRLLCEQTGEKLLSLCDRRVIFLCRAAATGRRVIFSSKAYAQGTNAALTLQATAAFASRAAMALPPFLPAMQWLGSPLVPEESPFFAAEQLTRMGADGILIVDPCALASHEQDALELSAAHRRWALDEHIPPGAGILRIMMPLNAGALRFECMPTIARAGFDAAQAQLDGVLSGMGMAQCRVIPFRKRAEGISRRS